MHLYGKMGVEWGFVDVFCVKYKILARHANILASSTRQYIRFVYFLLLANNWRNSPIIGEYNIFVVFIIFGVVIWRASLIMFMLLTRQLLARLANNWLVQCFCCIQNFWRGDLACLTNYVYITYSPIIGVSRPNMGESRPLWARVAHIWLRLTHSRVQKYTSSL